MKWGIFVVIVVFFAIAVITGILLWRFWPTLVSQNVNMSGGGGGPVSMSGFNQPCSNTMPCQSGLVCSGNFCKKQLGQACNSLNDCAQTGPQRATVCNGFCSSGTFGDLMQSCPCNNNLLCVNNINDPGTEWCLGDVGYVCNQQSDCVSGICMISQPGSTGICSNLRPNGTGCSNDQQCLSNNCSAGCQGCNKFCQPSGPTGTITTGTAGAICISGVPAPSPNITQPGCNSGLSCQSGVCVATAIGLNAFCEADVPCEPPQVCCFNSCRYPLDPNTSVNLTCSQNYTNADGNCLGNSGQPCTSNGQCQSSICSSIDGSIQTSNGSISYWNGEGSWVSLINGTPLNQKPFEKMVWYNPNITPGSTGSFINTGWLNRPYSLWASSVEGLFHYDGTQWSQVLDSSFIDPNINITGNIIPTALAIDSSNIPYLGYKFINTFQPIGPSGPTGPPITEVWDSIYQINISMDGAGTPTAFNTTIGKPGEQFDTANLSINIVDIDVSFADDFIIGDGTTVNDNIFVKRSSQTLYTNTIQGFKPRFYRPSEGLNNTESYESFSYVSDKVLKPSCFEMSPPLPPNCFDTCGQVINFNGQIKGQVYLQPYATPIFGQTGGSIDPNTPTACIPTTLNPPPNSTVCNFYQRTYEIVDYSIYSSGPDFVINGPLWIIARITQGATWSQYIILSVVNGLQRQVNGYADNRSRIVATASSASATDNAFFGKEMCLYYSPGFCS